VLALATALAAPAAHGAPPPPSSYTKLSFQVPVTQPDELGEPVTLDTDVYLPKTPPPRSGYPLIEVFHGGGSEKANPYDSEHAARFAAHGYASLIYSQRGHGASNGQTAVFGPKEIRDLYDVTAWALGIGGRTSPAHPDFHIDRNWIALSGYSQGGATTNLGQVWNRSPEQNPYGLRIRALLTGNTPDRVFQAVVPNQVVKLSFGAGLLVTYLKGGSGFETHGRVAPAVPRWIATAVVDQPALYGRSECDFDGHDTAASAMRQDLAWRSVGCFAHRMGLPWMWAQAFDDELFTPDMAISMWRRSPRRADHRLYLSMGGHAAPSAQRDVEEDKFLTQLAFVDAVRARRRLPGPAVVYWTRDPAVAVPVDAYAYPPRAWTRHTATTWPPPGTQDVTYRLGADGRAVTGGSKARDGSVSLLPLGEDSSNDPVLATAMAGSPLGRTIVPSAIPTLDVAGTLARFSTEPLVAERELNGSPRATLAFTPRTSDEQLVLKVFDQAPDGTLTLLSRGVRGRRGVAAGVRRRIEITGNAFSARIHRGHRVVALVMGGDLGFYKPYPGAGGGTLHAGATSTLTLPLRDPTPRPRRKARRKTRP
jgi:predicted acyl esterase